MGRGCSRIDITLTLANIFGVVAIVIIAAVIGTDRWLIFTVNRSSLSPAELSASNTATANRYYHTRHRGIFRECYPGNDTMFLDTANDVVDKNCFLLLFGDDPAGASSEYSLMNGLHMGFLVTFLVGLFFLIIAYITGLCLCVGKMYSKSWFAGLLAVISAFCIAVGFALFHGSFFVEKTKVMDGIKDRQLTFQKWTKSLQDATTITYGESYIAGWVGFVFLILTCMFYVMASCYIPPHKRDPDVPRKHHHQQQPRQQMQVLYPEQVAQKPVLYYVS